jgi:nucleoside phosphorylase
LLQNDVFSDKISSINMDISINLLWQEVFMTKVDFAIITIREDEFDAVLERFPTAEAQQGDSGRTYGICQVQTKTGKNCTVAIARSSEQGNDISQQVASDMIRDLDPQLLLVVGIAGGVPHNEFTLGDVIISSRIHNFNVNAVKQNEITFDVRGGIHPFVSNIVASLRLYKSRLSDWNERDSIGIARPSVNLSLIESNVYGDAGWRNEVVKSLNSHFGEPARQPRLPLSKTGSIASSNSLMKDTKIPTTWLESARSILAVEMESAGVLQAAQQMNKQYPVMAIRGISDIIGFTRDDQWTNYACQTAAAFAYAFVTAGIVTPRVMSTVTSTPASVSPQTLLQPPAIDGTGPINVFISYAEEDERFKKQLEAHLTPLRRDGIIRPWHSQQTQVGQAQGRKQEIANHIDSAQIILLLMSPSFLASDQLYDEEMTRAIKRQESGDAVRVIRITVRHIHIDSGNLDDADNPNKTPLQKLQKLQGLPRNGKPVEAWRSADEAWALIAQEIRQVCKDLRDNSGNSH